MHEFWWDGFASGVFTMVILVLLLTAYSEWESR